MTIVGIILICLLLALVVLILYAALVAASNADDIEEQELNAERKRKAERFWEDNEGDE